MKITQTIGLASAVLLAAGCAHEKHAAQYDETVSPSYGYSSTARTEYNTQNNISSPSTSSTYSGSAGVNGSYSTSNQGNYSGGISQGSQSQSDNTIVAQVRESLQQDPEIAFMVPNIQIVANNGAIILSGSVQSEEQKRQILSRVQKVTGVVTVNNQLNIMAGPNGGQGAGSLNPTSSSGSERLYKDAANGQDNSTNNALNPTSRENGPGQLYRESNQGQNNTSSEQSQNQNQNGQGMNESTNSLNPTSREGGSSQIYQGNSSQNTQDQNSNANTNSNQQINNQPMP